jgi:glycosyltransferase involved in cell wall biosynthesis
MVLLDHDGLSVEFVVVDNNSDDGTAKVVDSFRSKLPLRHLYESRQGKNYALNKALTESPLGRIIVFTDDDVAPRVDWLKVIATSVQKWPAYSVFGGRCYPIWPDSKVPGWALDKGIQRTCYGLHDYAETETCYPPGAHPYGINYWVRREVLGGGRLFDPFFGPRSNKGFVMGSEAHFLRQLTEDGYTIMHVPEAVVGHRIETHTLVPTYITKRAYRLGRGQAHWAVQKPGIEGHRSRGIGRLLLLGGVLRYGSSYAKAAVSVSASRRVIRRFYATMRLAYHIELLRLLKTPKETRASC